MSPNTTSHGNNALTGSRHNLMHLKQSLLQGLLIGCAERLTLSRSRNLARRLGGVTTTLIIAQQNNSSSFSDGAVKRNKKRS